MFPTLTIPQFLTPCHNTLFLAVIETGGGEWRGGDGQTWLLYRWCLRMSWFSAGDSWFGCFLRRFCAQPLNYFLNISLARAGRVTGRVIPTKCWWLCLPTKESRNLPLNGKNGCTVPFLWLIAGKWMRFVFRFITLIIVISMLSEECREVLLNGSGPSAGGNACCCFLKSLWVLRYV